MALVRDCFARADRAGLANAIVSISLKRKDLGARAAHRARAHAVHHRFAGLIAGTCLPGGPTLSAGDVPFGRPECRARARLPDVLTGSDTARPVLVSVRGARCRPE